MLKTKPKLVILSANPEHSPWQELGTSAPENFLIQACALTKIHEWSLQENDVTAALILDLDDLNQTQPLDDWALAAWKSTFNDLIAKCTNPDGRAPLLLAYTREPNWEKAILGVRAGARDIIKLSKLSERINEVCRGAFEVEVATNVVSIHNAKSSVRVDKPAVMQIPKHAIPFPIDGLEGTSSAIEVVRNIVRKTSPLDTSILIVGPTGSGKELVARCIHRYSQRVSGPFVAVNCGAIASNLTEAEFFGHHAGAFTGAVLERVGYLAAANGGTLFLDEVSELPLETQVKLLRSLQEKIVTPLGSTKSVPIDIRVISATQASLDERCKNGMFREDLLYRLRVMEITLPSLSERRSDILEISKSILKKLAKRHKRPVLQLSDEVLEKFLLYRWPGNIRELENALEHGATLSWAVQRDSLVLRDMPEAIQFASMKNGSEGELKEIVRRFEREYIAGTIRRLGGSKEEAAETLGLSLATLYRKLGS